MRQAFRPWLSASAARRLRWPCPLFLHLGAAQRLPGRTHLRQRVRAAARAASGAPASLPARGSRLHCYELSSLAPEASVTSQENGSFLVGRFQGRSESQKSVSTLLNDSRSVMFRVASIYSFGSPGRWAFRQWRFSRTAGRCAWVRQPLVPFGLAQLQSRRPQSLS